jgi:type I restriction enzyme S subunit
MKRSEWKTVPIKEVYEGLYDGPHATPKPADSGPVFLGIKNVTDDGRLDLSDIRHIAEEDFAKWTRRVEPRPGDLVFTYEATLNRYALIPDGFRGCLGRRMALIRPDKSKLDVRFLFHYFFGAEWRAVIASKMMSGATVDRIPLITFPDFPVCIPPLPVQQRIADTLSAYDDLIENNARRIQILERMAQALYREWFVNFRFPGHAKDKLVASPLGKIPRGWVAKKLRDICERVDYGYTASANWEPVGPKLLRITDIVPSVIDWSTVPFCELDSDGIEKYRLEAGDIVVARTGATTGYAKRLNKRHPESVFASYLVRIRVQAGNSSHVFGLAVESDEYKQFIKTNLSGSAQPQANAQVLASLPIVLPPESLQAIFSEIVEPMLDQKEILELKNANLRRTRDLLLPKLISGALDVSKLDIEAGSVTP